ncbi:MAG: ABC transporter ATP-binding protein [Anaerolineales bacterium]|nr:ABC transporter ATP-binding protein [Anaerolineales bacterium]
MTTPGQLIEVQGLKTFFKVREGTVRAVNGVSFTLERGRTLGVVGESGCGKSVMAQSVMRLVEPAGKIVEGKINFYRSAAQNGHEATVEVVDITSLDYRGVEIRRIRGGEIAMVFQDPMTSFSPVHTIGDQIAEALILHQDMDKKEALERAIETLHRVGMPKPDRVVNNFPHQLSGGMRQRSMIAMALSCNPSLLIADEPTTALDVTTEAQILELMKELQASLGMAIMFITHNLGVVAEMANEIIVMYLGKIVERADVVSLFDDPRHPYSRALLRSIPRVDKDTGERLESIEGIVPDPYSIPQGCPFHPRCPSNIPGVCDVIEPPLVTIGARQVYCHLYQQDGTAR